MAPKEEVVWTFVAARLASARLPRKVLADIHGESMVERVMRRSEAIGFPVALLIPEADKELAGLAMAKEWIWFGGSEDDVLTRFCDGIRAFKPDHVVRVTADCPDLSPEWARHTVDEHLRNKAQMTWDKAEGRGVQVFRSEVLLHAEEHARGKWEREHPDEFLLSKRPEWVSVVKWSVDTADDLDRARRRAR